MYTTVTTTITTRVEITDDGIGEIDHSVNIDPGELPQDAAVAAVVGAARALLTNLTDGED